MKRIAKHYTTPHRLRAVLTHAMSFVLLVYAHSVWAQSISDAREKCMDAGNDPSISACTKLIVAGGEARENMSAFYNNRGVAYAKKGMPERALPDFNRAIELAPDGTFAWHQYMNRGLAYQDMNRHSEAIVNFSTALTFTNDPEVRETIYSFRARSYEKQMRDEDAIADYVNAIAEYHRFLPSRSKDVRILVGLAWTYHKVGSDDLALPYAESAVALAPTDANALETRATIYEELGKRDQAIDDYRAILEIDPSRNYAFKGLRRLSLPKE